MRLGIFALITVVLSAFVALRLDMRTAITDFLPRDEKAKRLELSRELAQSTQSRAVVLAVGGGEEKSFLSAARAIEAALVKSGEFAWVRGGLAQTEQEKFYKLYFPARLGMLELPEGDGPLPDSFLRTRVSEMKDRLASPLGMLERRLAPEDPLGAFQGVLASFGRERGALELRDGNLVTHDGTHAILFAETRAPAFDGAAQKRVEAAILKAFGTEQARDAALTLRWTGVNRYALAGEASVREDIGRISTLSLVGIFLLYLLVFRSLREPLVVLLPISFGCLLAVAVCQGVFGFVHGLSLAFGSSIIGVAEDFSTHFFAHRRATPREESNESLMVRLWPGMWLGAATTVIGILALTASGFPGLVQMAIFGSVGVAGALVCTRYVVGELSRKGPLPPTKRLGPWGLTLVRALSRRPAFSLWFIVPALVLALAGGSQLRLTGGMRALKTPTPELDAENEVVQKLLGRQAAGRAVAVVGKNDEEALQRAEKAVQKLDEGVHKGLLDGYRSVTRLLPSTAQQLRTRARLAEPTLAPRLRAELTAAGFTPEAFAPFEAELSRKDAVLLTPAQILASPLADVVRPFRVELAHGIAYLVPVSTTRSSELTAFFADAGDGVFYLDQEALFDDAYGLFRLRAVWLLGVGLLLVVLTLLWRYRSMRVAMLGMLPAVLGAGATLGVEGLWGVEVTLMHVIAILLVISMGVDYGIYVLESRESLEEGVTTLGSILLAALTTVLSFGLLGLSDNPALAGIGITVSLGLLFTVLVSPIVLALARNVEVT